MRESAALRSRDRASDEQLLSYLLSLVQALQYERESNQPPSEGPLAALLIARAVKNAELANFLHWYLLVERNSRHGTHYAHVHDAFLQLLAVPSSTQDEGAGTGTSAQTEGEESKRSRHRVWAPRM